MKAQRWDETRRVGTFALDASNAWGESTSTLAEVILSEQVGSLNQESHGYAALKPWECQGEFYSLGRLEFN